MNKVYDLKARLCDELDNIAASGKLDMQTLEKVDKLSGAAYHLHKLLKAEEEDDSGYSERMYARDGGSYRGGSYRGSSYDDGYSERRDRMGRYSRDGGSSYASEEDMYSRLERLAGSGTDQERTVARKMLAELKR